MANTFVEREFRARVYKADDQWADPNSPEVEFTIPKDRVRLEDDAKIGGQRVKPLAGKTISQPFNFDVLDEGDFFTAKLGDSEGRLKLTGRLADFQHKDDGGSWETWATGRLRNYPQTESRNAYRLEITDERTRERNAQLFQYNTTTLFPTGNRIGWRNRGIVNQLGDGQPHNGILEVIGIPTVDSQQYVVLSWSEYPSKESAHIRRVMQKVRGDVQDDRTGEKGGVLNFEALTLHVDGVDRPVIGYGLPTPQYGHTSTVNQAIHHPIQAINPEDDNVEDEKQAAETFKHLVVWWPEGSTPSVGTTFLGYLHMPSKDASTNFPLHIGERQGLKTGDFLEKMSNGDYQFLNYIRSPKMEADTTQSGESAGVVDDWEKGGTLSDEATYSVDAGTDPNSQKISVTDASTTGTFYVKQTPIHNVWRQEKMWLRIECKFANLTGAMRGRLEITYFDASGTSVDQTILDNLTNTSFTHKTVGLAVPEDAVYARVQVGMKGDTGDDGDAWFRLASFEPGHRVNVLYDTSKTGSLNSRYPRVSARVTQPQKMSSWNEKYIYKPLGLVPFISNTGKVSPKNILVPTESDISDPSTLTSFTDSDTKDQVTFDPTGSEQVTSVVVTRESYNFLGSGEELGHDTAFDRIESVENTQTFESDRIKEGAGERAEDYNVSALMGINLQEDKWKEQWHTVLADHVLKRFQDSPIRGQFSGFTDVEDLTQGDYIKIDKSYYPGIDTGTKGGEIRIAQIMEMAQTATGPKFDIMDAGPDAQVLSEPTISVAKSTGEPRHEIEVTLDSLPSSADVAEIQIAVNDTQPAADSDLWVHRKRIQTQGNTAPIGQIPGGETIWVRARSVAEQRIASGWTSDATDTVTMDALPSLSGLSVSSITGSQANFSFTNNDSEYVVVFLIDGEVWSNGVLPPNTDFFTARELAASTIYTPKVRLEGPYGGIGPEATLQSGGNGDGTFTTSANNDQLAAPHGLFFVAGGEV